MKKFILIILIQFCFNNLMAVNIKSKVDDISKKQKNNKYLKKVFLLNLIESQSSLKDQLSLDIGKKYQCPTVPANLSVPNNAVQLTASTIVNQTTIELSNQIGKQIRTFTNQHRAANGLSPLAWNQKLANVGRPHTVAMANGTKPFDHQGFDNRFARYKALVPGTVGFGENLFYGSGFSTNQIARVAVNAWIKSPGHNANLLGNFNRIGVSAFRNSQNVWYITQLFALVR